MVATEVTISGVGAVFESHRRLKFKASLTAPGGEKVVFYCSKKQK
jgi:hypothetical protein